MDSLSSADLDTTSKTPMYIGVAAIIIGVTGVIFGWLGFAKASALEAELSQISQAAAAMEDLQAKVDQSAALAEGAHNGVQSLNASLNKMSEAVSKDMSGVKKDMRSIAIQAGTALKKLEAIEANGLSPAKTQTANPKPSTQDTGKASASGDTEVYTIQSGDMLYRVAAKFGVSVSEITAANPGIDPNRLRIGQEIVIPQK